MRGAIEINVLAGHTNMASFDVRYAPYTWMRTSSATCTPNINVLTGLRAPGGGTDEERPFEGNVDHRAFPLTVVGTQDDHSREQYACKAVVFFFRVSVHAAWLPLVVTPERLFDTSCQFSVVLAVLRRP